MILNLLAQHEDVRRWLPQTAAGFDFLLRTAGPDLAEGRHEIDGERVFALVQRYTTRRPDDGEPEAHRKYLDIQYLVAGRETIYWTPRAACGPVTKPYLPERDIEFFARQEPAVPVVLSAGMFCLLLPDDAHQPCCVAGAPCDVHKVVVKVRV